MKLIIPAFDQHYRVSATDYNWTNPGEILTIGTDDAFVGLDSRRYTTHGRVTALDVTRADVNAKIISLLTQDGFYVPGRERQSTETRRRMGEVFGLARGFEVGTVIGLHRGRPRRHDAPRTDPLGAVHPPAPAAPRKGPMDTMPPNTRTQQHWYLATLGHEALLRELAPLDLPASATHDPLTLAGRCLIADPIGYPEAHRAAERVLAPLRTAQTFTTTVPDEDNALEHTGVVPVLEERQAGAVTGWYAELLLFEHSSLLNKAAYRLSRMPGDPTWIIDSDFQRSGHPGMLRPFGSRRPGSKRTLLPPFVAELDRLIAQGPESAA